MKVPFVDLDKLNNPGAEFQFQGQIYKIKPIELGVFMDFNNAWFELQLSLTKEKMSEDDKQNLLFNLINSVTDGFTREVFAKMGLVQVSSVIQLIIDCVHGRALDAEEIKKKAITMVQRSSEWKKTSPSTPSP